MPFPAGLTLVTVHGRFDMLPSGGASGTVRFTAASLQGPTDNSIVPHVDEIVSLDASGEFTKALPATNDPQWTPQGFTYTVVANVSGATIRGTLQLDYQTTSVELADLLQIDGAAATGVTYIPLSYIGADDGVCELVAGVVPVDRLPSVGTAIPASEKGAAGGVATLDGTVHIPVAQVPDLSGVYLSLAGGTVTGNLVVQDAATPTKAYRLKTSGSNLDFDAAGSGLFVSVFVEEDFSGAQRTYLRLESGTQLAHACGRWLVAAGPFDGSGVADLDPTTGVAGLGAKNSLSNVQIGGRRATAGPPTTGTWAAGDTVQDSAGAWWLCTVGGTPGTWVGGAAPATVSRATVTTGDLTMPSDAGWTIVSGGPTLSLPAAVGDDVEIVLSCLLDHNSSRTDFFELVNIVSGAIVRFASTSTNTPAAAGEGDPSIYAGADQFIGSVINMSFTVAGGDLDAGSVVWALAHKGPGGGKVFASANYPLRWRARNDH